MPTIAIIAAALSAVFIVFAAFILIKRWTNVLAAYLALFMASVGVWIGATAATELMHDPVRQVIWQGVAVIGMASFSGFFLCFTHVFTQRRSPSLPWLAGYLLPAAVISTLTFISPAVSSGLVRPMLLALLLGSLGYGSARLGRHYRHGATAQEQSQILYMEIGFISLFSAAAISGAFLPMTGEERFASFGSLFSVVALITTAYATMYQRLLDIRTVIKRGIVYTLIVGFITALYLAFVTVILTFISGLTNQAYLVSAIATTCVGVLSYGPLRSLFNRLTDDAFFRNRLSHEEAVDAFSRALNESRGPGQMMYGVTTTLRDVFRADAVTFTVLNNSVASTDSARPMTAEECLQMTGECPAQMTPPTDLFVPLILHGRVMALIGLGEKKSGEPYFAEDLSLLTSFAYQTALALDKSQRYQQAKEQIIQLQDQHRLDEAALDSAMSQATHGMENSRQALELIISLKNQAIAAHQNGTKIDLIEGLTRLEQSAGKANKVTEGIRRTVGPPAFNLSVVVKRVTDHYAVLAERQGATLIHDVEPDVVINGVSQLIEDSLVATMGTALQHSVDRNQIRVTLHREKGQAVLCVTAQGRGMTPADLPPYFDQLRRGTGLGSTLGTGLQMELTPQVISLRDDVLEVKSTDDQTTEVCFKFDTPKEGEVTEHDIGPGMPPGMPPGAGMPPGPPPGFRP